MGEMEKRTIKTITCSFGGKASPFWALQRAMPDKGKRAPSSLNWDVMFTIYLIAIARSQLFKAWNIYYSTRLIYTNHHYMDANTVCISVNRSGAMMHNPTR